MHTINRIALTGLTFAILGSILSPILGWVIGSAIGMIVGVVWKRK